MESVTAFTTQTFFAYGGNGADSDPNGSAFGTTAQAAIQGGSLTDTAKAFLTNSQQKGIKQVISLSNASSATVPSVFNPQCGTATNPCNAQTVVAPDSLASAFGTDLATGSAVTNSTNLSTSLAGTTTTLIDSSNTTYQVPMVSVSPAQVNYYVPANASAGPATLTITSSDGTQTTGIIQIATVTPGIYTASADGKGAPAAVAVCAGTCAGWSGQVNGQFFQPVYAGCASGVLSPQPINLGAAERHGSSAIVRYRPAAPDLGSRAQRAHHHQQTTHKPYRCSSSERRLISGWTR